MLGKEFEIWLIDLLLDAILIIVDKYFTNLKYQEDGISYYMERLNGSIKE